MKRRIVGTLLVWLAAVATVAAIASFAIGEAGRQVTSSPVSAPSPIAVSSSAASPAVTHSGVSGTGPDVGPTPFPGASRPGRHSRAVDTDGGRIQARCAGEEVSLDGGYARPEGGWRARIHSAQTARLEVVFSLGRSRAVLVTAVCEGGAPAFRAAAVDPDRPDASSRTASGGAGGQPEAGVTEISSPPTRPDQSPAPSYSGDPSPSSGSTVPPPVASPAEPTSSGTSAPALPGRPAPSTTPEVTGEPSVSGTSAGSQESEDPEASPEPGSAESAQGAGGSPGSTGQVTDAPDQGSGPSATSSSGDCEDAGAATVPEGICESADPGSIPVAM
ncbi:hypothetical protein JCM9957A_28810 [Kineosporia succinea]|uniref:Uncharacterized protein n=1 Tax=Kineosporia succinea TaxID=84632 RepID=A0ABT9P2Z8_9ACTN|nr:hypothetical protein [Kineosporia succinea]